MTDVDAMRRALAEIERLTAEAETQRRDSRHIGRIGGPVGYVAATRLRAALNLAEGKDES